MAHTTANKVADIITGDGFMHKIEDNTVMHVFEYMKEARRLAIIEKDAAWQEMNASAIVGNLRIIAQLDDGIKLLKEGLK